MLNFFVNYLDFLANRGKGEWLREDTTLDKFHWRSGTERDTNGIYLWSQPYILEDKNGEEVFASKIRVIRAWSDPSLFYLSY